MKIIAGLGNPGPRYAKTRHNLGYIVLDQLAERLQCRFEREKERGLLAQTTLDGEKLWLVKPQTFMNRSGECLGPLARKRGVAPEDVLVVVDDIHLPLGRLRLREEGSAGGHNGLKSIIERMATRDFPRMRMGVGDNRENPDLADHVLAKFRPDEWSEVDKMVGRAVEAVVSWITSDISDTMEWCNRWSPEQEK